MTVNPPIENNDYVVVTQINLNKQGVANSDLALYLSHLAKGFYLDSMDTIRVWEFTKRSLNTH